MTPEESTESALGAHHAGASVAHIHVWGLKTTEAAMDFDLHRSSN
jgi:uncharacterized protein (DUF849 family)